MNTIPVRSILLQYWRLLHPFRFGLACIFVCIFFGVAMGILTPLLYKQFFDILVGDLGTEIILSELTRLLVWILLFRFIGFLFWRGSGILSCYIHPRIDVYLSEQSFSYLVRHSYQFFSDHFSGALVRKLNRFVSACTDLLNLMQWRFVPMVFTIIGVILVVSFRNAWIAIAISTWIFLFVCVNLLFNRWKLRYDLLRAKKDSELTGMLSDSITNAINIKCFNGFLHEERLYQHALEAWRKIRTFTWNLAELNMGIQVLFMIAIEIIVMFLAARLWSEGMLTVGDFALLQAYLVTMIDQMWDLGHLMREFYEHIADAREMTDILNQPHDVRDRRGAKTLVVKKGAIEFQNISFNFRKTRRVLNDFSLKIKPQEKIALIGPSGAGKSTVTKLLFRFFDVNSGTIFIDGQDISKVMQESLRSAISLVPQEPILFHRSLKDNIRYGRFDATNEEIERAAKLARCHEFIRALPDGYETFVGERGVKLSGGERQRVAIARAILKNAPILILDEATSSLDSESESLIQEALEELMEGKTVMVIAHRLSTIMKMDRIIVMDHGEVTDTGTHKTLFKKQGLYSKLWQIQAGGFR